MKPIKFDKRCVNYAESQKEYETLPVLKLSYGNSSVHISCWKLSIRERIKMLFSGKIYLEILGSQPPVNLTLESNYEVGIK